MDVMAANDFDMISRSDSGWAASAQGDSGEGTDSAGSAAGGGLHPADCGVGWSKLLRLIFLEKSTTA